MSVGDWCAKMWIEDMKGPLLQTPYYPSFLTNGSWSPTRPGVFFLTRADGKLDTWDYFYRMNEPSLTHKVSDHSLTCISVEKGGQFMAVGDADGVITLINVCDGLYQMQPNEKNHIASMFDRESKREKNLEQIKKLAGQGKRDDQGRANIKIDPTECAAREKAFFSEVGLNGDEYGTALGKASMEESAPP